MEDSYISHTQQRNSNTYVPTEIRRKIVNYEPHFDMVVRIQMTFCEHIYRSDTDQSQARMI